MANPEADTDGRRDPPGHIFLIFLRLGLTSFGGPVAHLAYFRRAFVERRGWLGETAYAEIVALCQFLPGPASSQVGFTLGLMRGGPLGALAAWCGFTLPSALLLAALALLSATASGPLALGAAHGLKLVAVAVVAQAVVGMARSLAPDAARAAIAVGGMAAATLAPGSVGQLLAIGAGLAAGLMVCKAGEAAPIPDSLRPPRRLGLVCAALFTALLAGAIWAGASTAPLPVRQAAAFYRSGALVFGGGHVVLPLLNQAVVAPGWIDRPSFLAGYGAAQAVPGPLFTVAAYLGAVLPGPLRGAAGAAVALAAIFLPGLLILLAALPFWNALRAHPGARKAVAGANAAVVGVLAAALYDPLWSSAIAAPADVVAVAAGFALLVAARAPPVLVVGLGVAYGTICALVAR